MYARTKNVLVVRTPFPLRAPSEGGSSPSAPWAATCNEGVLGLRLTSASETPSNLRRSAQPPHQSTSPKTRPGRYPSQAFPPSPPRTLRSAAAQGERSLKEHRLLRQRDRFGAAAPEAARPSIERSPPVEDPRRDQVSDAAPARSGRSPLVYGPCSRARFPG